MKRITLVSYGLLLTLSTSFVFASTLILFQKGPITTQSTNKETNKEEGAKSAKNDLVIQPSKIYDPDTLSMDSLLVYEKNFDFDWKNHQTIEKNKDKIEGIETFLKNTPNDTYTKLSAPEHEALGRILYRLGTYYLYVSQNTKLAIDKLNQAESFLKNGGDKAWVYNHLAHAYELTYADSRKEEDKKAALQYVDKVKNLYRKNRNKEIAFAYTVKGMIENDSKNFGYAEEHLLAALKIYESLGKDEIYARTKTQLANVILEMDDRDDEALSILKDLKQYWQIQGAVDNNPYAANNLVALGHAYLKLGKASNARAEMENAIHIYQNVYGENTQILIEPYQSMSDIYLDLGDQQLSQLYQQKASQMNL